jgi:hypothetical protein
MCSLFLCSRIRLPVSIFTQNKRSNALFTRINEETVVLYVISTVKSLVRLYGFVHCLLLSDRGFIMCINKDIVTLNIADM